jgi:hypothetical protein
VITHAKSQILMGKVPKSDFIGLLCHTRDNELLKAHRYWQNPLGLLATSVISKLPMFQEPLLASSELICVFVLDISLLVYCLGM